MKMIIYILLLIGKFILYIYFEESSEIIFASEEVFLKELKFSGVKIVKLEPKEHVVFITLKAILFKI